MSQVVHEIAKVVALGVGATAVMDLWLLSLQLVKVPAPKFRLVGRWIGHGVRGKWAHDSIAAAPPIRGEVALGWVVHYAVGVAIAGFLLGICGVAWMRQPTLPAAMAVGIGSVAAPLFVMQPAMGAGIASSRTAAPVINSLRSLVNHAVFGLGLYLTAVLIASMSE